ncbi:helix-turn-helix domain-containing protein (plasmid) [Pseudalkalibacillus hwajinpoensis]|uniref:helix-turn-helix domain-containing protein n=1 Tax=Guptibacillus hwajinpoensis TaxID=208199 RepID=UPI00325AD0CB
MTITQVAKYLQVSEVTMYKLLREGKIQGFKIGRGWRVRSADLSLYIEDCKGLD